MNQVFKLLLIYFFIVPSIFASTKSSTIKWKSEKIFQLKAGKTGMKISSNGGRIISYSYNQKEILTQSAEHENYGSTLWTSPQSDWGWPPFEVLDLNEYKVEKTSNGLKMTSKPDLKSGFQFEKIWQIKKNNSIQITYFIQNISGKPKKVGAWELSRVSCGGLAFFPEGGTGNVPIGNLKTDSCKNGINWIQLNKIPTADHQKLFSTAHEGWLAYSINGLLFIKQFADIEPEDYSPEQGEVEIYTRKDKEYAELENQGVYQLLQPNETLKYVVIWHLAPVPKKIKNAIGSDELVNFTRKQIAKIKN